MRLRTVCLQILQGLLAEYALQYNVIVWETSLPQPYASFFVYQCEAFVALSSSRPYIIVDDQATCYSGIAA